MSKEVKHNGIEVIGSERRGKTNIGWLESWHSFSFGRHYDPNRMSFRSLRVINDDVIAPGAGFGEHGHNDMEIITWVIDGALRHRDSLGHEQPMVPGELQLMRAGSGIRHSEFNDSSDKPLHLFQIWIEPREKGLKPDYWQKTFDPAGRLNQWQRLVSKTGVASNEGQTPFLIAQDANLDVTDIEAGSSVELEIPVARYGYIQVTKGQVHVTVNGNGSPETVSLVAGDALEVSTASNFKFEGVAAENQLLYFDLA